MLPKDYALIITFIIAMFLAVFIVITLIVIVLGLASPTPTIGRCPRGWWIGTALIIPPDLSG